MGGRLGGGLGGGKWEEEEGVYESCYSRVILFSQALPMSRQVRSTLFLTTNHSVLGIAVIKPAVQIHVIGF